METDFEAENKWLKKEAEELKQDKAMLGNMVDRCQALNEMLLKELKSNLTEKAVLTTEEDVAEWLKNGGVEKLEQGTKRAEKACELLREAARADPATLNQPMTI